MLYWKRKLSFLSCPARTAIYAVPTCTRMHYISKKQYFKGHQGCYLSHRNISFISYCVVFNKERVLAHYSQKILSVQTWLACLEPVMSLVPGRTKDFEAASQRHREHWKKKVGFHIKSLYRIDRDKVENHQSCPLKIQQTHTGIFSELDEGQNYMR